MDSALTILSQVVMMFVLIAVGFVCYRIGMFTNRANKQISNFVLTIVTAALILDTYQTDSNPKLIANLGICFVLSVMVLLLGVIISLILKWKGKNHDTIATERFGTIYPNSAYMGIPLLLATVGETGVFYASAFFIAFNLMTWTQGVSLLTGKMDKKLILTAITSPAIISIVIGLPMFLFQIKFPSPVASAVSSLAGLMTPLSMVVSGVFIAQTNLIKAFTSIRVYIVSFLKLIFIPAIVLIILTILPLDYEVKLTMLILSAAPCATGTMLFASRFGGDIETASSVFTVSTILCIITIPALIMVSQFLW